jgi:hypothetical protein
MITEYYLKDLTDKTKGKRLSHIHNVTVSLLTVLLSLVYY